MVYGFAIYKILYMYIFSKKKKNYVFYFFCQLLFSLKVTISTEKINANAAKDLERRCRGVSVMLNVCVFARSQQEKPDFVEVRVLLRTIITIATATIMYALHHNHPEKGHHLLSRTENKYIYIYICCL